jgi:uncharacterized membrane protein
MSGFMEEIFSLVCGQNPAHTWAPGGELLPLCQRCTGFYVGAALALILLLRFRPIQDVRYRWLHGMLLLLMAPFGFHLVPQDAVLRTLSGQWFGFGVVGLLWLLPGEKFLNKKKPAARSRKMHLFLGVTSLLLLPATARWGGAAAHAVLPWFALAGLAAIAGLVLVDAAFFLSGVFAWIRQRIGPVTS